MDEVRRDLAGGGASAEHPVDPERAGPLLQRVQEVLRPRARIEARLTESGEVRGRLDGVTPRTLKVAPGVIYVEIEKAGYKKTFRKITVDKAPARVVFSLADRRSDRAAQVESAVARLRGSDPTTHPTTLARLAELARVDVLVAIAVRAGTVKLWWFDSDRGDLMGDPIESRFDPQTGKIAGKLNAKMNTSSAGPSP